MIARYKAQLLWGATLAWIALLITSLHTNWLRYFFFDPDQANVQGIDFFPIPRAALNLLDGRSQFDTFHNAFGPYATWYLYHPIFAVIYGPFVSGFAPWHAYAVSAVLSLGSLAATVWFLLRLNQDPGKAPLVALLIFGSFPTFIMLYTGNVQPLIILAITLILVAQVKMQRGDRSSVPERMLLAGLLLSLFSKPLVLAMLPLLLLLPETRRTAFRALMIYFPVSLICLAVPGLNPVALTWADRWHLLTHLDIVKQTMNIYTNRMTVTVPMMDNSIHWFNLLGLSDFRLQHIDVVSLPVALDSLFHTETSPGFYRVPFLLVFEISALVSLIRNRTARLEAALYTVMAASLLLFVSYGLVWEYYYAAVMPLVALVLLLGRRTILDRAMLACGVLLWLPSLYVFVRHQDVTSLSIQTMIRLERVIPVTVLFLLLLARATKVAIESPTGLRLLSPDERG